MRIDSHQHFWHYTEADFGWIESPTIQRDFLPYDLARTLSSASVQGAVAVQARTTLEETRWLLELAQQNDLIKGVVGWVPWQQADALNMVSEMPGFEWLKGLRILIQGGDPKILEEDALNANVAEMAAANLACDLLLTGDQLPAVLPFVRRHPEQQFIIDHCAKPSIRDSSFDFKWACQIGLLAELPNVTCKVSGLVTEIHAPTWSAQSMQKYWEQVSTCFGAERLMFGSDWPVCLSRIGYQEWLGILTKWIEGYAAEEQAAFWSGNAIRLYRLKEKGVYEV